MRYILLLFFLTSLFSKEFDFNLKVLKIAPNTYFVEGKKEYFSQNNGGDIANSSFIVSNDGVLVIDTGSSYIYGKQLLKEIRKITNKPIKYVINTHHHPDHFLGNQAFRGAIIMASKYTKDYISKHGDEYITNLVNIVQYAMKDTEVLAPNKVLNSKYINLGKHKLKILYLNGHTQDDLVLYDQYTGVLFVSDLIFYNRAAATPHANIKQWIKTLNKLKEIPYKLLVSGHGEVSKSKKPIIQMISYLKYLDNILKVSSKKGLGVYEILEIKKPKEFKDIFMLDEEFERSIINLYPKYEDKVE